MTSFRENPEVISVIKEIAKKGAKPKEIWEEAKAKWPELSFGDVMSVLFKKPKESQAEEEGVMKLTADKKSKSAAQKKFPSTSIWVHPSVLLLYNYLVERGYDGSFSEFINASILKTFNLEPLFALDLDPELLSLKKERLKLQLQREVQRLKGKGFDLDEEIDKILGWYATIRVMEGVE